MTIIQPKLALKGVPIITSHELTIPEIMGKIGKFVAGAAATDNPDAPLVSGSHCKYCKHKSCSTRAGDVIKEMGMSFPVLNQPVDPAGCRVVAAGGRPRPQHHDPEKIAQIMLAAPLVRQMIESVEEEALRRLKAGQAIPTQGGAWSWLAVPGAARGGDGRQTHRHGHPQVGDLGDQTVTPAKVEKLKWEATKAGEKVRSSCPSVNSRRWTPSMWPRWLANSPWSPNPTPGKPWCWMPAAVRSGSPSPGRVPALVALVTQGVIPCQMSFS